MSDRAESCSETSLTILFFASEAGLLTVVVGETASTTLREDEEEVKSNLTLLPGDMVIRDRAEDFFDVMRPDSCEMRYDSVMRS